MYWRVAGDGWRVTGSGWRVKSTFTNCQANENKKNKNKKWKSLKKKTESPDDTEGNLLQSVIISKAEMRGYY